MGLRRRDFLKLMGAGAATSILPLPLSRIPPFKDLVMDNVKLPQETYSEKVRSLLKVEQVDWEKIPYKVDWSRFEPYSQANTAFAWGEKQGLSMLAKRPENIGRKKPGFTILDYAFRDAAWLFYRSHGKTMEFIEEQLQKLPDYWVNAADEFRSRVSPEVMTKVVKKAALLYGASLVGIAPLIPETRKLGLYAEYMDKIPEDYKYVITIAIEMDYEAYSTANSGPYGAAVGRGYSQMRIVTNMLAYFLRLLGYGAIPHGNEGSISVFWGIMAGLGEQSRMSILITPEYGPRVRLAKVFTNAPLIPDKPIRFGVWEFCQKCKKCAEHCPSGAIPKDEGTGWEGPTTCERKGVFMYRVNHQKCYKYWCEIGFGCGICVRVCPFNKKDWWAHSFFRDRLGPTLGGDISASLDDMLGYGEQKNPEDWWGFKYNEIYGG